MLHINLALIGHTVSEEKRFEYYGNLHVYSPRMGGGGGGEGGGDEPLGSSCFFFFRIIDFQSNLAFHSRFFL